MMEEDRADLSGFETGNPFHRLLGVRVVDRRHGYARVRIPATEQVRGGVAGSLHGGVLSALADIACLASMQGLFSDRTRPAGTAELNISYLRPALGEWVEAEATVIKLGKSLAVIGVNMAGPDGKLVASSRVSYAVRTIEQPVTESGQAEEG